MERRSERRRKVLKEGRVLFSDSLSVNCMVRDISSGGARLEFRGPVHLPSEFRLELISVELTVPSTPVWQRGNEAGIRFVGVGAAGSVDSSPQRMAGEAA